MDEVVLTIRGKKHYLWRAVDQHGNILDILVQSRRDKKAAKRFFRKLLKELQYVPRVIITDKLRSYGAAKREVLPGVEHRQHPRVEQSRGKFPPTHAAPREENAALQISQAGPTLSLSLWTHRWAFPTAQASLVQEANTVPFYRVNSWSGTR
jgi:transposase-like protein